MAFVPPTILEIIDIANISQYLASKDVAFDGIFNWGSLDKDLPLKIYDVREAVEWMYAQDPNYSSLFQVATYLYQLCGKYSGIAKGIAAQNSGQVTYNTNTGQILNGLMPVQYQFTVGDVAAPLNGTNLSFVINDTRIVAGSFDLHLDGLETPESQTTQVSYQELYTTTTITVTFNQAPQVGQIIRYQYLKGLSVNNGKQTQPVLKYTCIGGETEITFTDLINVPIGDILTLVRSGNVIQPVLGTNADMNALEYDNGAAGVFTVPTGDIFQAGEIIQVLYLA